MVNLHDSKEPPNFALFIGGPLFQLLLRFRLTTPALDLLKKRIIFITLFAWLPLFLLSFFYGKAWGGAMLPFIFDLETQSRFLVALPLLIAAELIVHMRLRLIVEQFIDRNIIREKEIPRFMDIIASAMKLRNSITAELILLVGVFIIGNYLWAKLSIMEKLASGGGSWYNGIDSTGTHLSLAGYWYIFVSRPIFQFIILRWYYRLFIWARFLFQTSRLKLNLLPTHPDRAGGLGFLALSCSALIPLILAHGALLAGLIANSIFFAGAKLPEFLLVIVGIVLFLMLIVLGPLFVFSPQLLRAKRTGLREYGILASRYVGEFDYKWVRSDSADEGKLLGSSDIQSLADMGNSFQVIREFQFVPFGKTALLQLILFTVIPIMPLVLTMIPLEELLKNLFQAIF